MVDWMSYLVLVISYDFFLCKAFKVKHNAIHFGQSLHYTSRQHARMLALGKFIRQNIEVVSIDSKIDYMENFGLRLYGELWARLYGELWAETIWQNFGLRLYGELWAETIWRNLG